MHSGSLPSSQQPATGLNLQPSMYMDNFTIFIHRRTSSGSINNCPTRCNTKQSIYYSASSLYMFRVSNTPIIRSTQNCNYSLRYCATTSLATLDRGSCTVPEAVVTVLCTPDDGCGWHPKHVQWTCRIINRLLCVASRWTLLIQISDARNRKHKKSSGSFNFRNTHCTA